jgi:rRNA maturation endonuclease Nob1
MKARAERLAEYLEDGLGWSVYEVVKQCKNGHTTYSETAKFCNECGGKLKNIGKRDKEVIEDLESAIVYALGKKP